MLIYIAKMEKNAPNNFTLKLHLPGIKITSFKERNFRLVNYYGSIRQHYTFVYVFAVALCGDL
jgi:hypothetical protein